jgi:hypothetical protein
MPNSNRLHHALRLVSAAVPLVGLALFGVTAAHAAPAGPGARGFVPWVVAQAQCVRRVGNYATNDRALAVRNELAAQGYRAWVETEGSLYGGTRSYAVFVAAPC